jgi:hypothetical protein
MKTYRRLQLVGDEDADEGGESPPEKEISAINVEDDPPVTEMEYLAELKDIQGETFSIETTGGSSKIEELRQRLVDFN